ncbi:superfamily II DNA or RNA helicase [Streptomyces sp. SAI-119]|uniref:SAV_2336 N-terminal domain-related protein n=1 Tax=Streptomyces sp. SAI-119 TaxID=2940541 RepID=UPI0024756FBE|nr:SAV_2336 N-terminal domain-related protein [Streptomyces sp. SAI-119]MDH6455509.1 superfamily II DNA or RNA helicase [Streptomyces sp. SAI-119]
MAEDRAAQLLAALVHTGLNDLDGSGESDVRDVLDALVLAAARSSAGPAGGQAADPSLAGDEAPAEASSTPELATDDSGVGLPAPVPDAETSGAGTASVWLMDDSSTHSIPGRPLSMGRAPALPNALDIGRALRPLRRLRPSRVQRRLDLGATVDHYTRTGVLVPQLAPAPEPWLEVVVVVDRGTSMAVWEETSLALTKMLRTLAAFRSVHLWHLEHPPQAPPVLHNHHGHSLRLDPSDPRHVQPEHRLLLVVSDCAAPAWRHNDLWRTLHTWGRTAPVALINPLPKRLWQRSGLDLPRTIATASVPASPGRLLAYRRPRLFRDDAPGTQPWQALPVLSMDARHILAWTRAMMRTDPSGCEAVLVPASGRVPSRSRSPRPGAASSSTPTSDAYVTAAAEAFTDGLRSPAVRLAIAASSLEAFTLPVLDVIRERLVPEAALADTAEFLTAGLLTAIRHKNADTEYRFHPAAAEHLRGLLSRDQAWDAHFALTDHLAAHPQASHGIAAALHSPTSQERLPTGLRPIAQAAAATARLLGIETAASGFDGDEQVRPARKASPGQEDDAQQAPAPAVPDALHTPDPVAATAPGGPEMDAAIMLRAHQRDMLDRLEAEREIHGRRRNLLVAPAGTGKTIMAAFDYKRLCEQHQRDLRLLFIGDRVSAVQQAHQTYRSILTTPGFGELLYGGERPGDWNHVFATAQSLGRIQDELPPDHFDVIVIDGFRGAVLPALADVLERFAPMELLGLSLDSGQADGLSIHEVFFDGRIAGEMSLHEALTGGLLAPLHYVGVADGTDFQPLGWTQGQYDPASLQSVLDSNAARAQLVVKAVRDTIANVMAMRAVGFCVSVEHAALMAQVFGSAGLRSWALTSSASRAEREQALSDLRNGDVQAIFCVDVLSDDFDIPEVDTLLLLRPVSSSVRFLQQLSTGLAHCPGKRVLTVLDFIGHHRKEFRLDNQFRAMTNLTHSQLLGHFEHGSPRLPDNVTISLDEAAKARVIDSLKKQVRDRVNETEDGSRRVGEDHQPVSQPPVAPTTDPPPDTEPDSGLLAASPSQAFAPSSHLVMVRGTHGTTTNTSAGIMLTPRLVLTYARPSADERLQIVRTDGTELACRTVWQQTGHLDAALGLTDEDIVTSEVGPSFLPSTLKWGRIPAGAASPVHITGFDRSGHLTELHGQAQHAAVGLTIDVAQRATAHRVAGTSGALVSYGDVFVGVVVRQHIQRAELVATPAASLLQDKGFRQTLTAFMATPYELEDLERPPPADSSMRSSGEIEALLQELSAELTALRLRAGNPSLRAIQRRADTLFPDEGASLPPSAVSSLLSGGYASRDQFGLLVRTLMSWDRHGQECRPPSKGAPELAPWFKRWEAITRLRLTRRQSRPEITADLGEVPDTSSTSVPPSAAGQQDATESHSRPQLGGTSTASTPRRGMQRAVVFVPDMDTSPDICQWTLEKVRSGLAETRPDIEVRDCAWSREIWASSLTHGADVADNASVSSLLEIIKRAWRRQRPKREDLVASAGDDLLRYQEHGHALRQLIKETVENAPGDAVTVLAHGYGGVACFDLLVQEQIGRIDQLITVASQAPFLYETGTLASLQFPQPLPTHFPRWLNIYDHRDLQSFIAAPLFPNAATDIEVDSQQPFPQAHSAYWQNPNVWETVSNWMN